MNNVSRLRATIWHIGGLWWPKDIMDLFVSTCAFVVFVCPHLFPIVICVLTCSPLCALTCRVLVIVTSLY